MWEKFSVFCTRRLSEVKYKKAISDGEVHQLSLGRNHTLMSVVWPFPFPNLWTVTQTFMLIISITQQEGTTSQF